MVCAGAAEIVGELVASKISDSEQRMAVRARPMSMIFQSLGQLDWLLCALYCHCVVSKVNLPVPTHQQWGNGLFH